ncbi:amidase [Anaerobacillus alkalidiazotrophicus]|uniref:Amidase n=1 Tax=Anaerobacillus alkalidiazotrophicus TaxID=472963 RepID=A0A1S2M4B1_9BACI|nr:amidase [Anaerobacillus alkalidiazotrophicus]OIJ18080.1 amidase [Anaerobacillus alkalidiazotrophicus]OIJ19559.1 amidase [Anaerobacillus alkalidiazotrophicus]
MKHYNAFIREDLIVGAYKVGLLTGQTFAVKDVFCVKGHVCSAGNPDWLRTHEAASQTATSIQRLLENGASLTGMTITDELMYSLNGENYHYGTPVNPKVPECIPGGSSSGSAVAVAGNLVDFALGTDTGGSVRIPAAYCGIYGIRPTHGVVPIDGVIPLASSFDTVGWMTKDSDVLLEVGRILLPEKLSNQKFNRYMFVNEAWDLADDESKDAFSPLFARFESLFGQSSWIEISEGGLQEWMNVFRILQGIEIWNTHGEWIRKENPIFGPDIDSRFEWASTLSDINQELLLRERMKNHLIELLGEDGLFIIPTTPGKAPLLNLSGEQIELRRQQTLQLSCIAGLAGLPQVTIPMQNVDGSPIGLSIIAGPHQDLRLLEWIEEHKALFQQKQIKNS